MPGRAVCIVIVTNLSVLSIAILETLAFANLALKYFLILASPANLSPKSLPPYLFDSHPSQFVRWHRALFEAKGGYHFFY